MISSPKTVPLLLGFDRQRWERRKAELRIRLKKELSIQDQTARSRQQIEAENLSYWTSGSMSFLRREYADEAERARARWHTASVRRPSENSHTSTASKCDMSEGKDSGAAKCDINDDVIASKRGHEASLLKLSESHATNTLTKCDMSESQDSWGPECNPNIDEIPSLPDLREVVQIGSARCRTL